MHNKIKQNQLKIGSKTLDLSTPKVMGILNITDDSFYDGGKYNNIKDLVLQTQKMLDEGASIIDIGAASSNPNSKEITSEKEWSRLKDFLTILDKEFPNTIFSIDTFHSQIAKKAIDFGVGIINDISGGQLDNKMFETIKKVDVPYIMMHMKGTPQNMQTKTNYSNVTQSVYHFFQSKINQLESYGVNQIIIDLGFGFSKTTEQNYQLLNNMQMFKQLGYPILSGVSRKSMIYKVLDTDPSNSLNGTTALHMLCLSNGSSILRAHDVKEANECIKLFNFAQNNK
ncbi:MAG: dihydropteroate synthase [Flavobacteriales bacterium]